VPSLESADLNVSLPPEKRGFFHDLIVGNRDRSAKRKKLQTGWNGSEMQKTPVFIALRGIPVQK
jgi:hypothetical protein